MGKGGRKQFSNPDQIKDDIAKEEERRKWREAHPDSDSEEESEEEPPKQGARGASNKQGKSTRGGRSKDESESEEESESSSEEESDDEAKKKGVAGMIEIENPNRAKKAHKKVSAIDEASSKPQLSRREREEIEKAKAKAHYQKLHAAGKTDEARADLARLAIIRKQREEAAAKREADQKAKEEAAKAKADAKTAGRR